MDLVVFRVVIAVMVRRDRKREIRSRQELIGGFKKWDSDEARYRIAGAVRRFEPKGTDVGRLVGLEMSVFSVRRHNNEHRGVEILRWRVGIAGERGGRGFARGRLIARELQRRGVLG